MPDRMSNYMSDRMPDRMSENMSDRISRYMSDRMPDRMSDALSVVWDQSKKVIIIQFPAALPQGITHFLALEPSWFHQPHSQAITWVLAACSVKKALLLPLLLLLPQAEPKSGSYERECEL